MPVEVHVRWDKTHRLIPSRYPPVDLFERIADPSEWEALAEIESLTNPRMRQEVGDLSLVPLEDRISGPGSSPVIAAFTHAGFPSRFSDGSFGVYYAANRLEVSLAEIGYHLTLFYARTSEPPLRIEEREYIGTVNTDLHDIRGGFRSEHDPASYVASQALSLKLKRLGSNGLVYDSVRCTGGECIAALRPRAVSPVIQGSHYFLQWDGRRVARYLRAGDKDWLPMP
jgi:hypothetical protein